MKVRKYINRKEKYKKCGSKIKKRGRGRGTLEHENS
jgi:hypothetical protein